MDCAPCQSNILHILPGFLSHRPIEELNVITNLSFPWFDLASFERAAMFLGMEFKESRIVVTVLRTLNLRALGYPVFAFSGPE